MTALVNDEILLPPVDVLVRAVSPHRVQHRLRPFHGLGVHDHPEPQETAPTAQAHPSAELVEDPLEDAGLRPAGEVPEPGAPADAEVGAQRSPVRAVVGDVADGVHHASAGPLLWGPAFGGLACEDGEKRLQQEPFHVLGVGGVTVVRHYQESGAAIWGSRDNCDVVGAPWLTSCSVSLQVGQRLKNGLDRAHLGHNGVGIGVVGGLGLVRLQDLQRLTR